MITRIKRIGLLALSSIAIMITLTIILNIVQYVFNVRLDGSNYQGLAFISILFGFGSAMISLWMSRWIAKKSYNIKLIDETEYDNKVALVYQTVRRIADQQGIAMPEVGVYTSPEVNAFATGPSKNSALVAVSSGLLQQMNDEAIRGVVGHEMAHIINGDMITTTLLQGILNTLVIFVARILASLISGSLNKDDDEGSLVHTGSYYLISTVIEMVLGIGVTLIVMRHSRTREYAADAGSAELLGSKEPMLQGLESLRRFVTGEQHINDDFSTLKISGGIGGLFASHPSLESRIQALQQS